MNMTTGQYVKHSLLYFVRMLLLLALIFGLLRLTGYARVSAEGFLPQMLSGRGLLLLGAILIWAAVYPKVGFVSRAVDADIIKDRESIIFAFSQGGYSLTAENGGEMTFRASSPLKRVWMAFGDAITVKPEGNHVVLTGVRKEVVQTAFRIETAVRNSN